MIQPPSTLNGTAGNPITIRAINDGAVRINGEYERQPVNIRSNYFILEGFNAHAGNVGIVRLLGNNNIAKRIVGWDAALTSIDTSAHVFYVRGNNNLLEDIAGFGSGVDGKNVPPQPDQPKSSNFIITMRISRSKMPSAISTRSMRINAINPTRSMVPVITNRQIAGFLGALLT
jgi:hypothetical protein